MKAARACLLGFALAAATAGSAAPPGTPTEAYRTYRKAFDQAKAFEELWPFMDKATLARAKAAPPKEAQGLFLLIKGLSDVKNVQVVKETVTGDRAVLEAAGDNASTGNRSRATVKLVKEDGAWKIQQESWTGRDSKP
jgi:hypothetical protein